MRKQFKKAITAFCLAAALLVGSAASGIASMAAPTQGEEAVTKTGTLSIKKIDDGTVVTKDVDGEEVNEIEYKPLSGAVYTAYKIMDITPDSGSPVYVDYSIVDTYQSVLADITPDKLGTYSSVQIEALTAKLLAAAPKVDATDAEKGIYVSSPTGTDGFTTIKDMDLGYYLVVETVSPSGYVASAPFLVALPSVDNYDTNGTGENWIYAVTVVPKNEKITLEKTITNGSNDKDDKSDTVGEGDIVEYQLAGAIPKYADEYFDTVAGGAYKYKVVYSISDILSDGLTLITESDDEYADYPIVVKVGNTEITAGASTFTLTAEAVNSETVADLKIEFAQKFIEANIGSPVVVTYAAKVNADAVVGEEGNPNNVTLTYSNKPGTETDVDTVSDTNTVYTFAIEIYKYTNEGDSSPLALEGAEFELYSDAGLSNKLERDGVDKFVSDADGKLSITGLDEGTYYLVETKSPAGYTLLSNPIKVVITAEKNTVELFTGDLDTADTTIDDAAIAEATADSVDTDTYLDKEAGIIHVAVENHKGFSLPATGGIGVFIFLGIAAIGIVTLCIFMKKKSEEE